MMASIIPIISSAQHSVARDWNEELLDAIRMDFARPTVHARNLFHSSLIMYDSWALFDEQAETVFLGKTFGETIPLLLVVFQYLQILIQQSKK